MKASHTFWPRFDDPNLVATSGVIAAWRLAEEAGWSGLVEQRLTVDSPNRVAKAGCVVAGMLTGADSIDDLGVLRHGGMTRLFTGVRAPSTLGTFLRGFGPEQVGELDAVGGDLLAGLAHRVPGLLAGGDGAALAYVDVDDTIRQVHGYGKEQAAFGHLRGVRGLNIQLATVSSPQRAPVILGARLRAGNTVSVTGADQLVSDAIATARAAGVGGQILVRADAGYYSAGFVAAATNAGVWFSVTAKMNPAVARGIASIPATGWTAIRYPHAIFDDQERRWISDAEVAEVPFTAFTSRGPALDCRLVVRRVKRLQPRTGSSKQGELFTAYRYHAFITNSTLSPVEADDRHRDHAIIEQVIAELKDGPVAHLPCRSFTANAAWLACAVIAFNLARAAAVAAGLPTARWATVRRRIINVPARIAVTGRRLILHLPQQWAWAHHWLQLHHATGPPAPAPSR